MAMETSDKIGSIRRTSIDSLSLHKTMITEQMMTRTAPGNEKDFQRSAQLHKSFKLTANIPRQLVKLLRLPLDLRLLRVGDFPSVGDDTVEDVHVAVGREVDEAALVVRVAADEQIADAVEHQTERAQHDERFIREAVEVVGVLDVILVLDVEQRLDYFDDDGEAEGGQEGADDNHRQHIHARPAERVAQRLLVLVLLLLLLADVLRHDLLLLLILAELQR